jgi:hypothetical protein
MAVQSQDHRDFGRELIIRLGVALSAMRCKPAPFVAGMRADALRQSGSARSLSIRVIEADGGPAGGANSSCSGNRI